MVGMFLFGLFVGDWSLMKKGNLFELNKEEYFFNFFFKIGFMVMMFDFKELVDMMFIGILLVYIFVVVSVLLLR